MRFQNNTGVWSVYVGKLQCLIHISTVSKFVSLAGSCVSMRNSVADGETLAGKTPPTEQHATIFEGGGSRTAKKNDGTCERLRFFP